MKTKFNSRWFDIIAKETIIRSFAVEAEDEDSAISVATKIICDQESAEYEEQQYDIRYKITKPMKKRKKSKTLGDVWHEQAVRKSITKRLAEKGVRKEWMKRNLKIIF